MKRDLHSPGCCGRVRLAGGELAFAYVTRAWPRGTLFLGRAGETASGTSTTIEELHPQLAMVGANRSHVVEPFPGPPRGC